MSANRVRPKYKLVYLNPGDPWPKAAWHILFSSSAENEERAKRQMEWFNTNQFSLEDFYVNYTLGGLRGDTVRERRIAIVPDLEPEVNEFGPIIA